MSFVVYLVSQRFLVQMKARKLRKSQALIHGAANLVRVVRLLPIE